MSEPLPFVTRLWFAWVCFYRVLFDATFASRAWDARAALPAAATPAPPAPTHDTRETPVPPKESGDAKRDGAFQMLALLQREGRLVDFLEQDVTSFSDADVGVAARVVHDGCRKALRAHATIAPVRREEEGASVTLDAGFTPAEVKLTGNVRGSAPYEGVLRHRGWRATRLALPTALEGHAFDVLAPAEVEL